MSQKMHDKESSCTAGQARKTPQTLNGHSGQHIEIRDWLAVEGGLFASCKSVVQRRQCAPALLLSMWAVFSSVLEHDIGKVGQSMQVRVSGEDEMESADCGSYHMSIETPTKGHAVKACATTDQPA